METPVTQTTLYALVKHAMLRTDPPIFDGGKRGAGPIKGILYLVFVISFIIGGIVLFRDMQLSNRVTETARGVVAISSETRALHQNARGFGTDPLTAMLISSSAVPSIMMSPNSTGMRHPWGGDVLVTGADQAFRIELVRIPHEVCARLSAVDARGQGVAGNGIISVEFANSTGTDGVVTGEVTLLAASAGCGDRGDVDVTFTYDR